MKVRQFYKIIINQYKFEFIFIIFIKVILYLVPMILNQMLAVYLKRNHYKSFVILLKKLKKNSLKITWLIKNI